MKNVDKERRKSPPWYMWIVFFFLLPLFLVFSLIEFFKDRLVRKKRKAPDERLKVQSEIPSIIPQQKPVEMASDEEFIARVGEFTGFCFTRLNGLSGGSSVIGFNAMEHPEYKERVLAFFEQYPIDKLLYGNLYADGYDLDHWRLIFTFEDRRLDRTICGYGTTEDSSPLHSLVWRFRKPSIEELAREERLRYKYKLETHDQ